MLKFRNRQILLHERDLKDNAKMAASKWLDAPIYGLTTPFIRHFHVVFYVTEKMAAFFDQNEKDGGCIHFKCVALRSRLIEK